MDHSPRAPFFILSILLLASCGDNLGPTFAEGTVGEVVRTDERFQRLEDSFEAAGLLSSLDEPGPITLLAPTNAGFDALLADLGLTMDELRGLEDVAEFVRYHVHQGELPIAALERATAITTAQGSEIHVRLGLDGLLLNDGVEITRETIAANNGVLHVIDATLKRPLITTTETVVSAPDLPIVDNDDELGFGTTTDAVTLETTGFIHSAQVVVDIDHPRVFDLVLLLQNASTGESVRLASSPRSLARNIKTTFADSALLDVVADLSPEGEALVQEAYRPLAPLEFLVGTPAEGEWQLLIIDFRSGEVGRLNSWAMVATVGEERPEPAIVLDRGTAGPAVLTRGFTESAQIRFRRVGDFEGITGDVELAIDTGLGAPATVTTTGDFGFGEVFSKIAADRELGELTVEVSAASGDVSRLIRSSAEVVDADASGIEFVSQLSLDELGAAGFQGNDVWGWTDPLDGTEYALMGTSSGTTFVDLSTPETPVVIGILPTETDPSGWRDIKVYADHAFIVSEATDHGLQIFDLTQLSSVTAPQTLAPNATYSGFGNAHNIVINEDTGFAYVVGATEGETGLCGGGLLMLDIRTPITPLSAGCFGGGVPVGEQAGPAFPTEAYIHDAQCVTYAGPDPDHQGKEICISSDGQVVDNNNYVAIADVTDKNNPIQLSRKSYAGAGYAHQGWLTEDHQYFILNDEFDEFIQESNTQTYVWDVRDLDNPVVIGSIVNPRDAIGHNTYIKGNLAFQANYTSGLRIVDITDIANGNGTEIAYFDSFPDDDKSDDGVKARCAGRGARVLPHHPDQGEFGDSGCGVQAFTGAWSNYPFFDSGIVLISDMSRGLFVVRPSSGIAR